MNLPASTERSARRPVWLLPAVLSAAFFHNTPAANPAPPPAPPRFAAVAQLREITPEQADQQNPVLLRGVVTFADTKADLGLFLQDDTGGIYVKLQPGIDAKAGQEIQIGGVTGAGDFVPLVQGRDLRVLGQRALPRPRPVSYEGLATGKEDSQWVEIRGVVRSIVAAAQEHTRLDLLVDGQRLSALITDFAAADARQLIGATVRVQGVCRTRFNRQRQLRAPWLSVTSAASLRIEQPAASDPVEVPLAGLLQFNSQGYYGHRVKVRGVVTEQKGDSVFIQEHSARLSVKTQQTARFFPGDRVEVIGFPVLGPHAPVLEDAILRPIGRQSPPAPVDIAIDQLPSEDYEAQLVRLRAPLINRIRRFDQQVLVLDASNLIVNALLDNANLDRRFDQLQNGSLLELTGVCVAQPMENWNASLPSRPESFELLLRSSDDVSVLQNPPWWTLSRLLWTLGIMSVVLMAGVAWVVVLDRRVRQQTAIIHQKIQREAVSEERTRIAREFHDTLEQELAAITIQLDTVAAQFNQAPQKARQLLDLARTMSRRSLAEARRSVWDLRSHLLEKSNLVDALSELAKPLAAAKRAEIVVRASGKRRKLPAQVENHLLRMAQEALANALKHSHASQILVHIDYQPQTLRLTIGDDGIGFDTQAPAPPCHGHFGLLDMRERAQKIGASLLITSEAGQGTQILVDLADNALGDSTGPPEGASRQTACKFSEQG
jgi:signal transduction histidine kinase